METKETTVKTRTKNKSNIDWREIGVALAVNAANGVIMGLTSAAIYRVANPRVKPAVTPELVVAGKEKVLQLQKVGNV